VTGVLGARRRNNELRSPHLSVALGQKVKRYAIEQLMSEQVVYETSKSLLPAATLLLARSANSVMLTFVFISQKYFR